MAPHYATGQAPPRPLTVSLGIDPWTVCRTSARSAERTWRIPANLLSAIARVESGRRNPATGQTAPWPWTINAEGQGFYFDTKAQAIQAARDLMARGVRSFDVGCMQINLRHHPDAFDNLDEAFDPSSNANYGARFLVELYETRRNWTHAAMAYHSSTPQFGERYQERLLAALPLEAALPPVGPLPEAPRDRIREAAELSASRPEGRQPGPSLAPLAASPRVVRNDERAGRDLASYRAYAIPLTGRVRPTRPLPQVHRPSEN